MPDYAAQWTKILKEAETTTESVAVDCGFAFATLVRQEYQKFTKLKVPEDDYQFEVCEQLQMNLSAKIGSVAGADKLAKVNPKAAPEILVATRAFCVHISLRDHVVEEGMGFSQEIALLCAK